MLSVLREEERKEGVEVGGIEMDDSLAFCFSEGVTPSD